jgi:hypothetical protein
VKNSVCSICCTWLRTLGVVLLLSLQVVAVTGCNGGGGGGGGQSLPKEQDNTLDPATDTTRDGDTARP